MAAGGRDPPPLLFAGSWAMELTLTPEEAEFLRALLLQELGELREEVYHAEVSEFKKGLKAPIPRWEPNRRCKSLIALPIPRITPSPAKGLGAFEPKAKKA